MKNFLWIGSVKSNKIRGDRLSRYFVNYIDQHEVIELRKTEHSRPIGRDEYGNDIMSELGTVVQQYVGLASNPESHVIEKPPTIIGISKRQHPYHGESWLISRPLEPSWIKRRTELDFTIPGCSREFVAGEEAKATWYSFYAESYCYAVGNLKLKKNGKMIKDLPKDQLESLFAEVDFEDFKFDPEGSIGSLSKAQDFHGDNITEVGFEDLCFCINCECLILQDDVSDGICGECGCSNPEHPAYEDVRDFNNIFDEYL